jgi:hypothetical protein
LELVRKKLATTEIKRILYCHRASALFFFHRKALAMVRPIWFRSAFPVRKHANRGAKRVQRQFDLEQLEQRTVMAAENVIFPTAYASQQADLRPLDVIRSQNCERRLKSAARGGRKVQRWGWVESTLG